MSNDLLQTILGNLGYSSLRKAGDNNWQAILDESKLKEDLSSEAILPTVLIALCKFSRTAKGAETILLVDLFTDWVTFIFGNRKNEIIETIAEHLNQNKEETLNKIKAVTEEVIRAIRKKVTINGSFKDIRNALTDSLDNALFHLPIHMQAGELLQDNTTNNSLNQMTESASGLIHNTGPSSATIGSKENRPVF